MKKKLIRKAVAASSAAIMLATACISNIPVSAASSSTAVPGSALAFNVSTDIAIIDTNPYIHLKISVTNNPTFRVLTYAVVTDSKLSFDKDESKATYVKHGDQKYDGFESSSDLPSKGMTTYIISHTANFDVSGAYDVDLYFQSDDYLTKTHTFQVAVVDYKSSSEGIEYGVLATNVPDEYYVTDNKTNITYVLGDIDNDKKITINDAQGVMDVVSGNGGNAISVNTLNQLLQKDALYSTNMTWRAKFPNLLCAEAADVTGTNKMIDDNDTKQVLSYYSQITAGGKPLSQIGTKRIKTITA